MGRCPALKLGAPGRPSLETACWPRAESPRFGCRPRDCRPDPTNPTDPRHQAPETLAATEQLTRGVKSGGLGLEAGGPRAGRRSAIWGPDPCREKRALPSPRSGAPQARGHRARGPAPRPPFPEASPPARHSPRPRPHALQSPRPRPQASQSPRPRPTPSIPRPRPTPASPRGPAPRAPLGPGTRLPVAEAPHKQAGCGAAPQGPSGSGGPQNTLECARRCPALGTGRWSRGAGLGAGPPGPKWPQAWCQLGPPGSRRQGGPWDSVTRPAHVEGPSHVILPGQSCQRQGA